MGRFLLFIQILVLVVGVGMVEPLTKLLKSMINNPLENGIDKITMFNHSTISF